jgi:hypothetical protein
MQLCIDRFFQNLTYVKKPLFLTALPVMELPGFKMKLNC